MGDRFFATFATLSLVALIVLSLGASPGGVVEATGTTAGADSTPPRFLDATPDASWQGTSTLTASVGVIDEESGVAPEGLVQLLVATGGNQTFQWALVDGRASIDLAGLVSGTHTLRWLVRDIAGNEAVADFPLRIDVTAPTSSRVEVFEPRNTSETTLRMWLSAADLHSQISGVRYGEDRDVAAWRPHAGVATAPEFELGPGDGWKTIHAQFRDSVGNVGLWVQDTILLDTRPPMLTSWAPQGDGVAIFPVTISATWDDDRSVTDDASGVHPDVRIWWRDRNLNLEFEITQLPTMQIGANGFTYNPGILQSDNEYRVIVQMKDRAWNVAQDSYWVFWT